MKKTLLMIALCSIVWQTFSQARTTSKDLYNDDNSRYADSMQAKKGNNATKQNEIELSRDSLRQFFGTYAFAVQFHMNIFSVNGKAFAQRVGDGEKFEIFAKVYNVFFLKAMPAELQFIQSSQGQYDTLILHQDGKQMKAPRIASRRFELYDTILHLDSALYNAYNARDLKRFMSLFSPDLLFYHDLTGKTNYKENLERFKN
jgi:hypothetical protein